MGNKHKTVVLVLFSTLYFSAFAGNDDDVRDGIVHIKITKRYGHKIVTTVRGFSTNLAIEKIFMRFKKVCKCNGTAMKDNNYGRMMELQGDQSDKIRKWLTDANIVEADKIKVDSS